MMNSLERLQGMLRRDARVGRTQPHAHHPVLGQRHSANGCMGPNALGQTVIRRPNLQSGFQDLETPLNVGQ